MKTTATIAIAIILASVAIPLVARRLPPPTVPPLEYDGIIIKAPNDNGRVGYIEVYDKSTGQRLISRVIFRNFIWPWLEDDVQWVYIEQMSVQGEKLIITNERGRQYKVRIRGLLSKLPPA